MTTSDTGTIEDGAVDFWRTSGNDLFALADPDGNVLAADARGINNATLKKDLQDGITNPAKHYLTSDGRLYEYSVRPLYFGSEKTGTLLGYVISGYSIDQRFLLEIGRGAGAEAAFVTRDGIAVTTLSKEKQDALQQNITSLDRAKEMIIRIEGERFLAISRDLTSAAGFPLRLVIMKSFDATDRAEREINRLIFLVGLLAMIAGAVLMIVLSRMVTRPLEHLGDRGPGVWRRQSAILSAREWNTGSSLSEPRLRADA